MCSGNKRLFSAQTPELLRRRQPPHRTVSDWIRLYFAATRSLDWIFDSNHLKINKFTALYKRFGARGKGFRMQTRTYTYRKLIGAGEERGGGFSTATTTASALTVADQAPYSNDVVRRSLNSKLFITNKTSNFNFKYLSFSPQKKNSNLNKN